MKLKIFAIVLVILISCKEKTKTNSPNNDWYKKKIVELNIHFSKTYEYEFRFGKPDEKTKFLVENAEYDKKGNLIKNETHDRSEYLKEFDEITTFSYDNQDNLIEELKKNIKGEVTSLIKYKNENGVNNERVFYNSYNSKGELIDKTIYKYDKKGNCIEYIAYDQDGKIKSKNMTKYNNKNEEIESKSYKENGDIEQFNKFKWIELKDGWKKFQTFNEKNELENEYSFIQNENGLVTESIYKRINEDSENKTVNEFDKNGLIIKITEYENLGEPQTVKLIERIKY